MGGGEIKRSRSQPDAALALWGLLGAWASQATQILYRGPAEDPLLLLLPEQEISVLATTSSLRESLRAFAASI